MIGYTKRPAILLETAKMDYYKYEEDTMEITKLSKKELRRLQQNKRTYISSLFSMYDYGDIWLKSSKYPLFIRCGNKACMSKSLDATIEVIWNGYHYLVECIRLGFDSVEIFVNGMNTDTCGMINYIGVENGKAYVKSEYGDVSLEEFNRGYQCETPKRYNIAKKGTIIGNIDIRVSSISYKNGLLNLGTLSIVPEDFFVTIEARGTSTPSFYLRLNDDSLEPLGTNILSNLVNTFDSFRVLAFIKEDKTYTVPDCDVLNGLYSVETSVYFKYRKTVLTVELRKVVRADYFCGMMFIESEGKIYFYTTGTLVCCEDGEYIDYFTNKVLCKDKSKWKEIKEIKRKFLLRRQ